MPDKILLVDEQLYMLRLIEHHLEKAGYELIKARNTEEARAMMATNKPSLVVGDSKTIDNLPAMASIRFSDEPPTMSDDKPEDGRPDEIVFHKPFSPTQLVAEVKRLIPKQSSGGAAL
jgi:two-component system alkaline phosphatase synthesis response regulator PhoP